MPKKFQTLRLKMIGCVRKCQFFYFLLLEIEIWLQNQIKRIILGIKTTIFIWIWRIFENKNITSSGRYHCFLVYFRFFRHFRSPVTSKTTLSARPRRFPITNKKPFDDISNLWRNLVLRFVLSKKKKLPEPRSLIEPKSLI